MPSFNTGTPWIVPDGGEGQLFRIRASQAKQMASPDNVYRCAKAGGQVVITAMQDLIYSSPELEEYADVAERLRAWDDGEQAYVGVKPDDSVLPRALEMEQIYPVLQSTLDLQKQNGQALAAFERCLSEQAF